MDISMKETKQSEITQFIIDYIAQQLAIESSEVKPNDDFVESGLLDSFAILSLIMTLECQYPIKFLPQELANQELRVIATMAQAISKKLSLASDEKLDKE